jgi:hypothetical protein
MSQTRILKNIKVKKYNKKQDVEKMDQIKVASRQRRGEVYGIAKPILIS